MTAHSTLESNQRPVRLESSNASGHEAVRDGRGHVLAVLVFQSVLGKVVHIRTVAVQVLVVEHLWVPRHRTLGHERGRDHHGSNQRKLHARREDEPAADIATVGAARRVVDTVQVPAQERTEDGVQDYVERVQERHHGTQRRHILVLALESRQAGLNVRGQRNIARRPPKRNGHERGRHHPGLADLVAGRVPVRDVPHNEQHQGVEPHVRQWRLDQVRKQEYDQRAEQLTHVGAAHHQLRPARLAQVPPRHLRRDAILQVPMAVQRDGVPRHEPDELARREDDLGPDANRLEKEPEAAQGGLDVARLLGEGRSAGALGRLLLLEAEVRDKVPRHRAKQEADGGHDEGAIVAQLRDEDQSRHEGAGGTGDFVKDVNLRGCEPWGPAV